MVAAALLSAVAGGLLRAGADWPALQGAELVARAAGAHAALMLSSFLGMVIAIERAVAVRRRWAFAAPVAAGLGGLALLAERFELAAGLGVAAAAVSVAVHLVVLQRQRAPHTALLLLAACAWLVGNGLFAAGRGQAETLPWWFLLPVLTIAAERLEMTRLTRRHALAQPLLQAIVAALLAGAVLSPLAVGGGVLFGLALTALALWFGQFDIARRTLFAQGLPRYMAACLLAGYAWLAVAGLAWVGMAQGGDGRDLALHALGLGFIFSMVMGHAPVILPAVAGVKLLFGPWFYLPLLVLHASLLLRVVGGTTFPALRTAGAELNAAALLLFLATVVASALAWRRRHR
ncbi:MAG: hypothetical protein C0505_07900 [Leptothrix sp. (in: Bacteria)]|nr:hypothetical protein [Leptothrix sp. (in: b-proteobacteria)]